MVVTESVTDTVPHSGTAQVTGSCTGPLAGLGGEHRSEVGLIYHALRSCQILWK